MSTDVDWADCPRVRVKEVARLLGCSVSTVWAWVRAGHLPAPKRVGSRFSFWVRGEIEFIAKEGKGQVRDNLQHHEAERRHQ